MIKSAALIVFCAFGIIQNTFAAAPYDDALAALKSVQIPQGKEFDALLAQPDGPALLADPRVASLLGQAQNALELFRHAAEQKNDGYLFGPKAETFDPKTPIPAYSEHLKLFRLLLLDARVASLRKQRQLMERDLLAAMGFIIKLSEQKSGALVSVFFEQWCLQQAAVILAHSIQGSAPNDVYLKELARRLNRLAENLDFMEAALVQEGATFKGAAREGFTPELLAKEQAQLPIIKRMAMKKIQNAEYFSMVYSFLDTAQDEQTRVVVEASKRNDARRLHEFYQARTAKIDARKLELTQISQWWQIKDGLKGGPRLRRNFAQASADAILRIATPDYSNLISRHHVFLCELHVMRTALAVELFRRGKRRLPRDLSELVPTHLSVIPPDSFNRFQPLRYAMAGKKFKVYSFGPEGKDDGGLTALDWEAYLKDPKRSSGSILFSD